jgi:Na+/melibiose symporter-like transporter
MSMLWNCLVFAWVPFLGAGDVYAYLAVCVLSGMSVAADMALPAAIQADLVDLDTSEGGGGRTGLFFGLWNMATKISLALAVGIGFPALQLAGFDPQQPEAGATLVLALFYGAVPIVFKFAATALVWHFPRDRAGCDAVRQRMDTTSPATP